MTGIRNPDLNLITYQWTKNNGSSQIQVSNFKTLIFSPLMLSDAGQYICEVTVGSEMYGAIEYINIESKLNFLCRIHTCIWHKLNCI